MKDSNLYLLYFPAINAIKIGKANVIQNRIRVLTRHWGKVDYEGSYYLEANEKIAYKFEKSLQFLLAHYKLDFDLGDGKEEMFKYEALEHVKKHIKVYLESSGNQMTLTKGVPRPLLKPVLQKQSKGLNFNGFIKRDKKELIRLNENHFKILKIHKIVHFLLKHHERIKYQYSYDPHSESFFKIAFVAENLLKNIDQSKVNDLFSFQVILGSGGTSYITQTSSIVSDTSAIVAFKFFQHSTSDKSENLDTAGYHIYTLLKIIRQLPERSSLLTEDILTDALFNINYSAGPLLYVEF